MKLRNNLFQRKSLCLYYLFSSSSFTTFPLHKIRYGVGIPLGDHRKEFAEKISAIERPVYFEASPRPIPHRTDSQRGIFVVYISQSQLRPHMDVPTGAFYRRGEGGKAEIMKFYEVREQMMYTEERMRKVTLFRLKLARYRKIALEMFQTAPATKIFYRFETGAFDVLLADICGLLPPSTGLLEQLLEIPVMATVVNEILDHITPDYIHSDSHKQYQQTR